ncbi:NfeD family protein [uncultured Sunxiuqinia sp.]|uniref:NfeD family protein n=1 Tax=uncultured Sunxiuqinia sp. TaxID=1573825 RepID=UPI00198DA358|nr:nodulation protein NfeD [Sunxiuqinia sp.]|tara:strand:- start:22096 stop:23520 length:1425 start_codon:yes stop_codon:yes gene_type:complete
MRSGLLYVILFLLILATPSWAQEPDVPKETRNTLVYKFNIKENIAPAIWRQTKQAFEAADSLNADLMLIHMNTYGGTVLDADSIRTKILNSPIPVYVFIDNNAASAGALISVACDSIYMRPGGSIGAATVVNQTGQQMPDKYQSYMRSTMRATAEAHGGDTIISGQDTTFRWFRDPQIAEAMVDERVYIPGIIDTGKVLTFTPSEAMKYGFCEGIADNVPEVLELIGVSEYEIVEYKPTTLEKIIGFLVNPMVSGLLIMAILGGIYFEMQTPGIGFPLIIAITAAVAYFAPLYLEGLAANWEILLFVVGLILIALEIFVIPGFGVAGLLGILFSFTALVLSLINNVVFDFEGVHPDKILSALTTVIVALFGGFILSLVLGKRLFTANSGAFKNLSLHSIQDKNEGFVGVDTSSRSLVGKEGVAYTTLRPSGKVKIDGKLYDAVSGLGMIDRGDEIIVIRTESAQLYVEKKPDGQ